MLATALLVLVAACSETEPATPAAAAPPPPTVGVVTIAPETLAITNELPGRIAPTRIAEVLPRVSGILVERVFEQGSYVEAGDVLYRIDPAPFQVEVDRSKATLQRAEATELQARQQFSRYEELRKRDVASVQQLDNAIAALAQADADVASAKAGLAAAELNLQYASVTAPIAGRIGRATITEGALVGPTSGSLATIQQLDPVYADFTQSVGDLIKLRRALRQGMISRAQAEEAEVHLIFDDGARYPLAGTLLLSEAMVDATTGQVTLRGEFPNPDGDLLPGMYVRVELNQGIERDAIAVPQQAVQRDTGGRAQVYVVAEDGTVELRTVVAGRVIGERWVIDDGLAAGERVVVEGFQKIRPGAPVTAEPWRPAAAEAEADPRRSARARGR